jgi:hypothetical protein
MPLLLLLQRLLQCQWMASALVDLLFAGETFDTKPNENKRQQHQSRKCKKLPANHVHALPEPAELFDDALSAPSYLKTGDIVAKGAK